MSERFEELRSREQVHYFPAVRRWPVALERGEGSRVWDVDGKEYVDLQSGWGVTSIGHCHPRLAAAIADQARTLLQTTNVVYSRPQLELAERLERVLPPSLHRPFFVSSGTEANEGALKLAHKATKRSRFVAALGSFHGRTLGALGCLGQDKYRARWTGIVRPATFVPFGDLAAARAAIGPDVAGFIIEPIQGEGGVNVAPTDYLLGVQAACRAAGALLIFDEIQTGIGRTGRWLALEHSGSQPDIVTLGKGIGGGVPLAAFIANDAVLAAVEPGDHGGTYAGNLLACRAGATVLQVIEEEKLVERADRLGAQMISRLGVLAKDFANRVECVRGAGLLIGLVLRDADHAARVHAGLIERGVLVNLTADRVLRIFPALNIPEADFEQGIAAVEETVREVE